MKVDRGIVEKALTITALGCAGAASNKMAKVIIDNTKGLPTNVLLVGLGVVTVAGAFGVIGVTNKVCDTIFKPGVFKKVENSKD